MEAPSRAKFRVQSPCDWVSSLNPTSVPTNPQQFSNSNYHSKRAQRNFSLHTSFLLFFFLNMTFWCTPFNWLVLNDHGSVVWESQVKVGI